MKKHRRLLLLAPILLLLVAGASISVTRSSAQPPVPPNPTEFDQPLDARVFRVYTFTPAARTASGTIPVDGGTWVTFNFGGPSKTLRVTLTSPTGQVLSSANGDALIYPDLADPNASGHNYQFTINQPAAGTWSYQIEEPGAITTERTILLDVFLDSPVRTGIISTVASSPVGRPIALGLVTVEGQTILTSGLTISATLTRLDSPTTPPAAVSFLDGGANGDAIAGDGLFTALLQPEPGQYFVEATITGTTAQGQPFLRTGSTSFDVIPALATLSGAFTDRGIDDNGDGLFDRIGVSPGVDVTVAGDYNVVVTLRASNNATVTANIVQPLAVGAASVEVPFAVEELRRALQVDGPYTVSRVSLERISNTAVDLADERVDLGATAAYRLDQLARQPIVLGSGGAATGVDTNGNGKFDFLDVSLPVNIQFAGSYNWDASLKDRNGNVIGRGANGAALNAGDATLTFRFDGTAIGQNGVDGPYIISDLFIYNSGGQSLFVTEALTTQAFRAAEFEGSSAPPVANAGGPYTRQAGQPITLDGSGSTDPDGSIVRYEWDFESDGTYDVNATIPTATYTYPATIPTTATLRVTDNSGLTGVASALVSVAWVEPLEWYDGLGTMSGVRRVANYARDQFTCDSDEGYEHVFSFTLPRPIEPGRFRWWALDVTTDQQLKAMYGSIVTGKGLYGADSAANICMDDKDPLPGGIDNVRNQLRLSWSATAEWRWQEPIEWYDGNGTMSGVSRVANYTRDQSTCDGDAGYEHVFAFDIPTTIDPARFRWWALNNDSDQQLKLLYGTVLDGKGVYGDTRTVNLCMDDVELLPGGVSNVREQLRLSWTAP